MHTIPSLSAALQTLELDPPASVVEIKQAYRDLVQVWHPDRFSHNMRLQQKAAAKLQQLNQAYEYLTRQDRQGCAPSRPASGPQPPYYHPPPRRRPAAKPPKPATNCHLQISLSDAEQILHRYRFESQPDRHHAYTHYHGGPFELFLCDCPLEVILTVPCDSFESFDRILLSIPCKSTGHFIEGEARHLLELLHTQN